MAVVWHLRLGSLDVQNAVGILIVIELCPLAQAEGRSHKCSPGLGMQAALTREYLIRTIANLGFLRLLTFAPPLVVTTQVHLVES